MNVRNSERRLFIIITKLRGRSQITLPTEITKKMRINPGDTLEITMEDDKIILRPVLIIDRSQSWFWSKEWQEKEHEADRDLKNGKVSHAKNIDELTKKLES